MDKLIPLPKEFGQGWLSPNAADMIKIAVAFGNFDIKEIMRELPKQKNAVINLRTVGNVLQRIKNKYEK